jgi:predicted lipid-binding transport protein (Tim44 family)
MANFFDLTTLITIALAVFVLLRLRSVLGKRTGHQRPPFEPYEIDRKSREARPAGERSANEEQDNVVSLPGRAQPDATAGTGAAEKAVDAYAKPGTKLNRTLKEVVQSDPGFRPEKFLEGARMAYEMIVTAFADGDRRTLKNLLSREVYDGFAEALSERENRGEEIRSNFVGIEDAKIKGAVLTGSDAQITVQFISQLISSTVDSQGKVIEGDPDKVAEVKDIWTFARDIRSRDPNWKLVATESEI